MTETETAEVEMTCRIAARPETVWRFWTDPARLCDWWSTSAELEPAPGGVFRAETTNGLVMRGEYVELVPHERIVFSFGWESGDGAPDIAPGSTRVEVTLVPEGGDTVLTLRHTGLPTLLGGEHRAGWEHVLPMLVDAVARADSSESPS